MTRKLPEGYQVETFDGGPFLKDLTGLIKKHTTLVDADSQMILRRTAEVRSAMFHVLGQIFHFEVNLSGLPAEEIRNVYSMCLDDGVANNLSAKLAKPNIAPTSRAPQ